MTDFSYQLYCSRNFPPLSETLKMVAAAGYKNVEGYGALYADEAKVAELTANLHASGLRMPTGHFGLDQLEREPDRVLEIAKAVGIETIYCPYLMPDQRPDSGKGWLAFGQRLQEAALPYRDAGLGFGWHNHDFEFKRTADGALPHTAIRLPSRRGSRKRAPSGPRTTRRSTSPVPLPIRASSPRSARRS